MCPDGSAVGRTGPNCEFAECPTEINGGTGNNSGICPAVCVPLWVKAAFACVVPPCPSEFTCLYDECGSGYGADGVNTFKTQEQCNAAIANSAQITNPASVNCIDKGGTLEIIQEEPGPGGGGQVWMCTLPNGHECEEWALFRGECS
ncbi:MAG TPA: DUF333 domain-containing protein [Candidatus Aenigmarchaeota archaeon]|nr:DUF333 domain-containing protein [Candidatus Aenigmarchaeota archaeon]